jgi:hypothetical protein
MAVAIMAVAIMAVAIMKEHPHFHMPGSGM